MCSCRVRKRSILEGVATLLLVGIVGSSADVINRNVPNITTTIANSPKESYIVAPVTAPQPPSSKPKPPDCYLYLPGTPAWNECFRYLQQDMAKYQANMHDFVKEQSAKMNAGPNGDSASTRIGPGQFYSSGSSFFNTNSMSTSNSYTGGYAIHAVNMAMSTSLINNVLKVTLHPGPIDKFDSRTNGNEITLSVVSKGQRKWVRINVPKGIKVSDVRVERSSNSIYVTGPVAINLDGNFQVSQSESSNYQSGTFNNNYGQMVGGIPSIPMPEFQSAFQNMFQNIFANIFGMGGRALPFQNNRPSGKTSSYEGGGGPMMWFY